MDSYTWVNPEDGSRVEIRFPVERIRYLPCPDRLAEPMQHPIHPEPDITQ